MRWGSVAPDDWFPFHHLLPSEEAVLHVYVMKRYMYDEQTRLNKPFNL